MTRVHVTDDVWADFSAAAGPMPLNLILGQLVEREVARDRSRRLKEGEVEDRELLDALERARGLHADLQTLVARLECRVGRDRDEGIAGTFPACRPPP
jgi:hypothetical protein